ncbi:MAG TPA: hypothetical protein VM425_00890 [Myxococcota bacterium]|nr:hypothetical protein [Myxococcota bacterium]
MDVCDGSTNMAMELDVRIDKTIRGDLDGKIIVHIGNQQLLLFYPQPLPAQSGGIDWVYGSKKTGKPLGPGLKVGLALHRVEKYEIWSLMGEPMFGLDDTQNSPVIVFQQVFDECGFKPPAELNGLAFDQFIELVGSYKEEDCADAAAERRQLITNVWGLVPDSFMAAVCMPHSQSDEPVPESCTVNADCGPTQTCVNGWCQ